MLEKSRAVVFKTDGVAGMYQAPESSGTAMRRTRSSVLNRSRSGSDSRRNKALARWIASRVRTGSTGNIPSARRATSEDNPKTAHRAAACPKTVKRSTASASLIRDSAAARRITRRVSMRVNREQTTFFAFCKSAKICSPASSLKSQRNTTLSNQQKVS